MSIIVPLVALLAAGVASAEPVKITAPSLGFPQSLEQSWAQQSPYFPAATYVVPPSGCEITQVNLLQRHGARWPKKSQGKDMKASVKTIQNANSYSNPNMTFITDYTYDLGTDDLVTFGAQQSFDAGEEHYVRYASLVSADIIPFVRASDSERVIESALNWTAGFAYTSNQMVMPMLNVIISQSGNDTLDDDMCPNAGSSDTQTTEWMNVFTPSIVTRLNSEAPGADLADSDVINLMMLCQFDTVYNEAPSPWCNLFTADEFTDFEYYGDLDDYYSNGWVSVTLSPHGLLTRFFRYGATLGPVQGVGYVNELIARLTGQPVQDETQTNYTLDHNPTTFPLDLTFYADFSHDNEMVSIFSAIGLFPQAEPLNTTSPNPDRTWVISNMVPFSGRLITERLTCDGVESVRMLVNDAVQPLAFCDADEYGVCTLSNFVASQSFATSNGDGMWAQCYS
ncbi:histidine phosphatase superfamily [Chiua virens]|nr:histidine phosphatase superfamily [Chiua virens]